MIDRRAWLLLALPALGWAAVLVAWEPAFWSFVFDDSFYYGAIARRIAAGEGSTFDGIHPTNGYHPLWMGFVTALFALGLEGERAMRLALLLQLPMLVWGLGCLWEALRGPRAETSQASLLAGLLGLAAAKDLVKLWVNGLESALVLVFLAPLLWVASRDDLLAPGARRARALASALLIGAFLARTDAALLLPAFALWAAPRLREAPAPTARALVALLAPASVVVLAFMLFNQAGMGEPVQVSGTLKRAPLALWRLGGAGVVLALGAWLAAKAPWEPVRRAGALGLYAAMLVAYYAFLQRFPRLWYFGPVALWALFAGGWAMGALFERAIAERPDLSASRALRPLQLLFGAVLLAGVGRGAWSLARLDGAAPMLANREAALHVAAKLPAEAVLASWDAGVAGFYAGRPVVNLDGVVQSGDFLRAYRAGRVPELLAPVPIGWVLNHADLGGEVGELEAAAARLIGPRAEGMAVVARWPFEVTASINGEAPRKHKMAVHLWALPGTEVPPAARHDGLAQGASSER